MDQPVDYVNVPPRKPVDYVNVSPKKGLHDESNVTPKKVPFNEAARRQGYLMPLPSHSASPSSSGQHSRTVSEEFIDTFQQCAVSDPLELGIPVDEIDERRIQELRDAVSALLNFYVKQIVFDQLILVLILLFMYSKICLYFLNFLQVP